jgi:Ca-activated chloride channel family protein
MKKFVYLFPLLFSFLWACDKEYNDEDGAYIEPLGEDTYSENYEDYGENPFISAADQPVSTFAIDADGASYSNMRRYVNLGQTFPPEAVRVEEFVNYFNFDYEQPAEGRVGINTERTVCPWNTEHELIRIGLMGKRMPEAENAPANFVFLIDVSGSMNSPEKLGVLKTGFKLFVDQCNEQDRISIVTYAGSDAVLLEGGRGDEKDQIKGIIDELGAGGSTAGAAGISTAYEIAQEYFLAGGNNRVILGSDGDFNVGPSSTEDLVELIEEKRKTGIYLTVLGVGSGNLNDAMMEQLANNGNGNYEYIDNINQIKKVFIYEYSKFYTVAKDCKIKVTFDPAEVDKYRLIGYENRLLDEEEFEEDSTDAGEIGSGQSITALYEIIPAAGTSQQPPASIEFRYKVPNTESNMLINTDVVGEITAFESSSEHTRFAVSVAGLALIMKNSEYMGNLTLADVKEWSSAAQTYDPYGFRAEFTEICNSVNK